MKLKKLTILRSSSSAAKTTTNRRHPAQALHQNGSSPLVVSSAATTKIKTNNHDNNNNNKRKKNSNKTVAASRRKKTTKSAEIVKVLKTSSLQRQQNINATAAAAAQNSSGKGKSSPVAVVAASSPIMSSTPTTMKVLHSLGHLTPSASSKLEPNGNSQLLDNANNGKSNQQRRKNKRRNGRGKKQILLTTAITTTTNRNSEKPARGTTQKQDSVPSQLRISGKLSMESHNGPGRSSPTVLTTVVKKESPSMVHSSTTALVSTSTSTPSQKSHKNIKLGALSSQSHRFAPPSSQPQQKFTLLSTDTTAKHNSSSQKKISTLTLLSSNNKISEGTNSVAQSASLTKQQSTNAEPVQNKQKQNSISSTKPGVRSQDASSTTKSNLPVFKLVSTTANGEKNTEQSTSSNTPSTAKRKSINRPQFKKEEPATANGETTDSYQTQKPRRIKRPTLQPAKSSNTSSSSTDRTTKEQRKPTSVSVSVGTDPISHATGNSEASPLGTNQSSRHVSDASQPSKKNSKSFSLSDLEPRKFSTAEMDKEYEKTLSTDKPVKAYSPVKRKPSPPPPPPPKQESAPSAQKRKPKPQQSKKRKRAPSSSKIAPEKKRKRKSASPPPPPPPKQMRDETHPEPSINDSSVPQVIANDRESKYDHRTNDTYYSEDDSYSGRRDNYNSRDNGSRKQDYERSSGSWRSDPQYDQRESWSFDRRRRPYAEDNYRRDRYWNNDRQRDYRPHSPYERDRGQDYYYDRYYDEPRYPRRNDSRDYGPSDRYSPEPPRHSETYPHAHKDETTRRDRMPSRERSNNRSSSTGLVDKEPRRDTPPSSLAQSSNDQQFRSATKSSGASNKKQEGKLGKSHGDKTRSLSHGQSSPRQVSHRAPSPQHRPSSPMYPSKSSTQRDTSAPQYDSSTSQFASNTSLPNAPPNVPYETTQKRSYSSPAPVQKNQTSGRRRRYRKEYDAEDEDLQPSPFVQSATTTQQSTLAPPQPSTATYDHFNSFSNHPPTTGHAYNNGGEVHSASLQQQQQQQQLSNGVQSSFAPAPPPPSVADQEEETYPYDDASTDYKSSTQSARTAPGEKPSSKIRKRSSRTASSSKSNLGTLVDQGVKLVNKKKFEEALNIFKTVLLQHKDTSKKTTLSSAHKFQLYYKMAYAYHKLEKFNRVEKYASIALDYKKKTPKLYALRAKARFYLKNFEGAKSDIDTAIDRIDPDSIDANAYHDLKRKILSYEARWK